MCLFDVEKSQARLDLIGTHDRNKRRTAYHARYITKKLNDGIQRTKDNTNSIIRFLLFVSIVQHII